MKGFFIITSLLGINATFISKKGKGMYLRAWWGKSCKKESNVIFLRMCNVSISQSQRLRRQFSEGERESNMTCGRSAITLRNTKVQAKFKSSSQIQKFKSNTKVQVKYKYKVKFKAKYGKSQQFDLGTSKYYNNHFL